VHAASFDNFVGAAEQNGRDRQTEHPGGLEIDDQLELCRLLNREIGRLGAAASSSQRTRTVGPIIEPPSTRIVSPAATIERSGPGVPKVPDNDRSTRCR